jgi:hypothetical protein
MFESLWNLVAGVFSSAWDLVAVVACFFCDIAVWLHVESPRLEGLLIGILLAWLLARRESHPLLRVLSSPLKLVLDILDLAWDQVDEVVKDVWGTVSGWAMGSLGWLNNKLKGAYSAVMRKLQSTKDNLEKEEK